MTVVVFSSDVLQKKTLFSKTVYLNSEKNSYRKIFEAQNYIEAQTCFSIVT